MLRAIQRISAEEARLRFKDHVLEQRPVIITDLYNDQPLLKINTPEKMASELAGLRITIGSNYYDKFVSDDVSNVKDYVIKIEDYLKTAKKFPEMDLLCREQRLPQELESLFKPAHLIETVATPDPRQMFYVANNRTVAPLHFDGDQREVLFTQVVGQKKIYLVEPKYSSNFIPVKNFSSKAVHKLNDKDQTNFFATYNAFHCVLNPGETLYMPRLWWHMLENVGITMATSVRFGTSGDSRSLQRLPLNYLTQNIVRALLDPITGEVNDKNIMNELMEVNQASNTSGDDYKKTVIKKLSEVYQQLCPQCGFADYSDIKNQKFEYLYGFPPKSLLIRPEI